MNFVILATSFSPASRSRELAFRLADCFRGASVDVSIVDIRELPQTFCDGGDLEDYPPEFANLARRIEESDGVVVCHPVHNYSASGATRNLIEIVGGSLERKPVAVASASGSGRSHLASGSLFLSMCYEYGSCLFPDTFQWPDRISPCGPSVQWDELKERLEEYARDFVLFARALKGYGDG